MISEQLSQHLFTIVRFRDGDTVDGFIRCRCCGGSQFDTVRILGIDSHEPKGHSRHRARDVAERATAIYRGVTGLLTTQSLRRDKYGRICADIIVEESAISMQLVKLGLAWWGVGNPDPGEVVSPMSKND